MLNNYITDQDFKWLYFFNLVFLLTNYCTVEYKKITSNAYSKLDQIVLRHSAHTREWSFRTRIVMRRYFRRRTELQCAAIRVHGKRNETNQCGDERARSKFDKKAQSTYLEFYFLDDPFSKIIK